MISLIISVGRDNRNSRVKYGQRVAAHPNNEGHFQRETSNFGITGRNYSSRIDRGADAVETSLLLHRNDLNDAFLYFVGGCANSTTKSHQNYFYRLVDGIYLRMFQRYIFLNTPTTNAKRRVRARLRNNLSNNRALK